MTTRCRCEPPVIRGVMIRCVPYASCYVYSPAGSSAASDRSRRLCELLKAGDERFIGKYADRVRQQIVASTPLEGYIAAEDILIPIPGSAPRSGGAASVAEQLSVALLAHGIGHGIWSGLRRVRAVQKSATAIPGSRPTVGCHYDSFAIEPASVSPRQVVLVDDIVTKGRTLLAAAACVQEAYPGVRIRAFALIRTMGLIPGVSRLLDPCVGEIRWRSGDACRTP